MNSCELEFVFLLIIKVDALVVQEGHYWHFPPWRPQKADNHIEEPLLNTISDVQQRYLLSLRSPHYSFFQIIFDQLLII